MVCRLRSDSVLVDDVVEGFDYSNVTAIHQTRDSMRFIVGTDDNGLFQMDLSGKNHLLSRFKNHPEWETLSVQSIFEDSENDYWISTFGSGVIQIHFPADIVKPVSVHNFDIESGLSGNDAKTVLQDMEGNYWIGLYGEGISILKSYAFSYYTPGKNTAENNIIFTGYYKDKYLLGTPVGFHLFDPDKGSSVSFISLSDQVGKSPITSYCLDERNNLWIGTGGNGLYLMNDNGKVRLFERTGDSGSDQIRDITWISKIYGYRQLTELLLLTGIQVLLKEYLIPTADYPIPA